MKKTYIVVGSSAAGFNAFSYLHQLVPEDTIIGITQDNQPPSNKCLFIDYLTGHKEQADLFLKSSNTLSFLYNKTVTALDPQKKILTVNQNEYYSYDKLLIATGTKPFIPFPFCNVPTLQGLLFFHTLSHVLLLRESLISKNTIIIIGAGITGLECASTLAQKGHNVIVIEKEASILPSLKEKPLSHLVENHLTKTLGITFYKETIINEILYENQVIQGVRLSDNKILKTKFVILTTGTQPSTLFASCLMQKNGFIVTNEYLQTDNPSIYAAGDCVYQAPFFLNSPYTYQWSNAVLQGIAAAFSMTGYNKLYRTFPPFTQTTLGEFILSFGGNYENPGIYTINSDSNKYEKIIVDSQGSLRGFILIGKIKEAVLLRKQLIKDWSLNA